MNDYKKGFNEMAFGFEGSEVFEEHITKEIASRIGDTKQEDVKHADDIIEDIRFDFEDYILEGYEGANSDIRRGAIDGFEVFFKGVWDAYFVKS